MKHLKQFILLCLFINTFQLTFACSDPGDYTALRALYLNTDGDNWTENTGWPDANFFNANQSMPSSIDMSTWHGMVCINGRIIYIYLENNNLNGSIPSEIGLLSELVELNVRDNQLISGTLPNELWSLSDLNRLYMANTNVSGSIPAAISGLISLEEIEITYNQMSGPLPIELTQLQNLYSINLCGIGLNGTMPASIYTMSQLVTLSLCDNNLAIGQLSSSISNLSNLQYLDIGGGNLFTGAIPSELWDLSSLRFIGLSGGSLTGQIPPAIGNLILLETLLLDDNSMSGPLPQEMKELTNMDWISITNNSFSGTIDHDFFDKWTRIHDVRLGSNQFTGDLPNSLGDCSSLRVADFHDNQFTGCFPYNYKNLCTNKTLIPGSSFSFFGNAGLGANNGDFDAFCSSGAGSCTSTIDCNWIEITINTGTGPLFFKYNLTPFDYSCNGGPLFSGEYALQTTLPNTTLTYIHELEENWYRLTAQNLDYNGIDVSQTIEVKEHGTSTVIVPQVPIAYYISSDFFPVCNPAIINQNLTVTNNNDSGPGSLRQAIIDSNCSYGKDEINILTTGVINLTSCDLNTNFGADCFIILPSITDELSIFGNGITLTSNTTGRLFNSGSDFSLKDLTIDNIQYTTFLGSTGGAIWNGNKLNLENITFSNNHTAGAGGAIYSFGDIEMLNCTFSNNSSGNRGGAMVLKNGTCKINHCTFTENSSGEGGAIYTWPNFPLEIENSILANNLGDADLNLNNALVTNNTNLVESCVGVCPTFYSMADPQLGPLQDNGGVSYTHALQAGTPGSVISNSIQLLALAQTGPETINYTLNGCGAATVTVEPDYIQYACALGDDGVFGTPDDGQCIASCIHVDDGNGTITIYLNPSFGDPNGMQIPPAAECNITVTVPECGLGNPAIDALAIGSVLLDQRGYDVFNGEKDLGAYEYGGVDDDGCDIVEYEQSDIMGNSEQITAHLMVGGDNTIDMNANVLYQASLLIDLKPGFEVVQGSIFEAAIGPCN